MKKSLFYLVLALSFAQTLNAQVVNIPDARFKSVLLFNPLINTNKDNEIQVSEAIAYSENIDVYNRDILNLTGIEAFVNIKKLYCAENQLTTLDVSKNIALTGLYCHSNQLTTLDVSKNIALRSLSCSLNQLTTLDVSKNILLTELNCHNSQLITLDVSKNIALTDLDCSENQLTALDVSKNIALTKLFCYYNQLTTLNVKNGTNNNFLYFYADDNPLLKCIQVDDPNKIGTSWKKDDHATYSTNCSVSTNDNTAIVPQFNLYPNPASQTLHIDWQGDATPIAITLYNSIGAAVKTQQLPQQGSINIADLPRGIYLCRIDNANHQSQTTKVVIE